MKMDENGKQYFHTKNSQFKRIQNETKNVNKNYNSNGIFDEHSYSKSNLYELIVKKLPNESVQRHNYHFHSHINNEINKRKESKNIQNNSKNTPRVIQDISEEKLTKDANLKNEELDLLPEDKHQKRGQDNYELNYSNANNENYFENEKNGFLSPIRHLRKVRSSENDNFS